MAARRETAVSQPHDKYFYSVFSNEQDAVSLLRTCVPRPLAETLKWSTLTRRSGRFVADDWRGKEADLLFSVEREGTETPVLVYVLLEHQSTPDQWLRLRLLGYCVQVWQQWRRQHESGERLPLIVPLVFYQGAQRWRYEREFADLVTDAAPEWRWVPRFEHLLIDQTELGAESVTGAVGARVLQIAMMATFREAPGELLERATRLIGELYRAARVRGSGEARGVRAGDAAGSTPEAVSGGVAEERAGPRRRGDELRGRNDRTRAPGRAPGRASGRASGRGARKDARKGAGG